MNFCIADPPYPGKAHRYPEKEEVDHALLIETLQRDYDGWALCTDSSSLQYVLSLCPDDVRIAAWCKGWTPSARNTDQPMFAWEPLIYRGWRKRKREQWPLHDWIVCQNHARGGPQKVLGQKPKEWCMWVFQLLNMQPDDELTDLFPGSGAISRAWEEYRRTCTLQLWTPRSKSQPAKLPIEEAI